LYSHPFLCGISKTLLFKSIFSLPILPLHFQPYENKSSLSLQKRPNPRYFSLIKQNMKERIKIKKDKYLRERGGTAKIINLACAKCGNILFAYQKDGSGWLKRCYLNRIIAPEAFANLQFQFTASTIKKMKNLICTCGNVIGTPMLYRDGRIAYHLERGTFQRKNITRATFPKESRISER